MDHALTFPHCSRNGCGPTRDVCDKVLQDAGLDLSVCPSINKKFSFHDQQISEKS